MDAFRHAMFLLINEDAYIHTYIRTNTNSTSQTSLSRHSFIHSLIQAFHSASSSPLLLRGAPDFSTVKENSFKGII